MSPSPGADDASPEAVLTKFWSEAGQTFRRPELPVRPGAYGPNRGFSRLGQVSAKRPCWCLSAAGDHSIDVLQPGKLDCTTFQIWPNVRTPVMLGFFFVECITETKELPLFLASSLHSPAKPAHSTWRTKESVRENFNQNDRPSASSRYLWTGGLCPGFRGSSGVTGINQGRYGR